MEDQVDGYTDYVQPERLTELVDAGVLASPVVLSAGDWVGLPEGDQRLIDAWPGSDALRLNDVQWASILIYSVEPQSRDEQSAAFGDAEGISTVSHVGHDKFGQQSERQCLAPQQHDGHAVGQ